MKDIDAIRTISTLQTQLVGKVYEVLTQDFNHTVANYPAWLCVEIDGDDELSKYPTNHQIPRHNKRLIELFKEGMDNNESPCGWNISFITSPVYQILHADGGPEVVISLSDLRTNVLQE